VDIFYLTGEQDEYKVAAQEILLNQKLLDEGVAKICSVRNREPL